MQRSARFAVTSLRVLAAAALAFALPAAAADLRVVRDPARIREVFPPAARVRVLNIWATWCVPCVEELPDLREIDAAFGPELAVAGVSLDDMIPGAKQENVKAFLDQRKVAFPNIYYTGNPDDLGKALAFNGEIPVTIVYDQHGRELWRHDGRLQRDETISRLRDLLRRSK
jgi:thiol-disulfide isomerase/thioredoxin